MDTFFKSQIIFLSFFSYLVIYRWQKKNGLWNIRSRSRGRYFQHYVGWLPDFIQANQVQGMVYFSKQLLFVFLLSLVNAGQNFLIRKANGKVIWILQMAANLKPSCTKINSLCFTKSWIGPRKLRLRFKRTITNFSNTCGQVMQIFC